MDENNQNMDTSAGMPAGDDQDNTMATEPQETGSEEGGEDAAAA